MQLAKAILKQLQLLLTDSSPIGYLSVALAVKEIIFKKADPTYDYDFHNAPSANTLYCRMAH